MARIRINYYCPHIVKYLKKDWIERTAKIFRFKEPNEIPIRNVMKCSKCSDYSNFFINAPKLADSLYKQNNYYMNFYLSKRIYK